MVLRCAKSDATDLQLRLTNAFPNKFGKGVEFIPYQLSSIWSKEDYLSLFHQQNQYIADMGAVEFQGVPEWLMDEEFGDEQTLQQFLLTHAKVQSVKKSDTPRQEKWWVLAKKVDLDEVTNFLNMEVERFMEMNNPLQHTYTPPQRCSDKRHAGHCAG